ncbi:MAG TPA: Maf family protein [Bacteroidota bacterium]
MVLKKPLVLASRSPRRLHLLRQIGLDPLVVPCDIPETFDLSRPAAENAESLAVEKARTAARNLQHCIVIGADTIVSLDGTMLGKPETPDEAARMLTMLSGKTHLVHTGYALIDRPTDRTISGSEETSVMFRTLPPEEIAAYVAGGSPMDKAGAYGIQDDYGAVFVRRIEGCFYNVVGLPLSAVYAALQELQTDHATDSEKP